MALRRSSSVRCAQDRPSGASLPLPLPERPRCRPAMPCASRGSHAGRAVELRRLRHAGHVAREARALVHLLARREVNGAAAGGRRACGRREPWTSRRFPRPPSLSRSTVPRACVAADVVVVDGRGGRGLRRRLRLPRAGSPTRHLDPPARSGPRARRPGRSYIFANASPAIRVRDERTSPKPNTVRRISTTPNWRQNTSSALLTECLRDRRVRQNPGMVAEWPRVRDKCVSSTIAYLRSSVRRVGDEPRRAEIRLPAGGSIDYGSVVGTDRLAGPGPGPEANRARMPANGLSRRQRTTMSSSPLHRESQRGAGRSVPSRRP